MTIAVRAAVPEAQARAEALAARLELPLAADDVTAWVAVWVDRIELQAAGASAISVEFARGAARYRRLHGRMRDSQLARAVGARGGRTPFVVDATAGLGRDSFALAALGCRVLACERSRVLHALLEDGLARAHEDSQVAAIVADRLQLFSGDARTALDDLLAAGTPPDVVYVDPMYPEDPRQKAMTRKEMRILRLVAGDDPDAAELLAAARAIAPRVVIKRPASAPPLAPAPTQQFTGRSTRYDMYLGTSAPPERPSDD